jgi:histidine ammonia-lyase
MKSNTILLNGEGLTVTNLYSLVSQPKARVNISKTSLGAVAKTHNFLQQSLEKNNKVIYGINTGFGPMASYLLARHQLEDLQTNLILSHAVGLGQKLPDDFVLAAMAIRLNTLAKGYSGASPELLQQLEKFINLRIIPIVPNHGSVGASGDLVQLAHIALALLGQGQASFKGKVQNLPAILKQTGLKPYKLKAKEGLSLINGTAQMSGIAALVCYHSHNLLDLAVRNGSLALELVRAYQDGFGPELQSLRPHPGQIAIATAMRQLLKDSRLTRDRSSLNKNANHGDKVNHINESVQEFYSLRCLPQILGPVYQNLHSVWETVKTEINSAADNPIVYAKNRTFLHGGNFHGDYVAAGMDQLKAGLVKLTMLSERRLNFFLHDKINGLFPPFMNLHTPGLTLALQAMQFTATSTTARSQTLAFPMSVHSIPSNADNQDVVSMGTDAALLAAEVLDNAYIVLAIELLALCQGVDFLKNQKLLSTESRKLYQLVRKQVPSIVADRHIQPEMESLVQGLKSWDRKNIFKDS